MSQKIVIFSVRSVKNSDFFLLVKTFGPVWYFDNLNKHTNKLLEFFRLRDSIK